MKYTEIFKVVKHENFQWKKFDILLIFCSKHRLWPRRGGSNEYPQSMFLSKNKKNRYTPVFPIFFYIKVGFKGVYITRTCFLMQPKYKTGVELDSLIIYTLYVYVKYAIKGFP